MSNQNKKIQCGPPDNIRRKALKEISGKNLLKIAIFPVLFQNTEQQNNSAKYFNIIVLKLVYVQLIKA